MKKYGFPYKGSKNKLAERIVDFLPKAANFYDLFAGGFAVTHAALESGKYERYYANDINPLCVQLFKDAVAGKYKNETRWIGREDFIKLKDKDGYVAFVWSFGNNGRDYLYSKEIEPYKKAIHEAVAFCDKKELELLYPNANFDFLDNYSSIFERKRALSNYMKQYRELFRGIMSSGIENDVIVQHINCLQRLESLETCVSSYKNIKIKTNSIIYCDIPYLNTNVYGEKNSHTFNYKEFYKWCDKQKELVFISSYEMPESDFVSVKEFEHRSTLSATKNNKVVERLFIPRHQVELYNSLKSKGNESYLFPEYFNEAV